MDIRAGRRAAVAETRRLFGRQGACDLDHAYRRPARGGGSVVRTCGDRCFSGYRPRRCRSRTRGCHPARTGAAGRCGRRRGARSSRVRSTSRPRPAVSRARAAARAVRRCSRRRRWSPPRGNWASSPTVPHFKTGVFHEHVAWAFVKAFREGGDMAVTLDDGRHAFAMIDTAYRSLRSGRAEPIKA